MCERSSWTQLLILQIRKPFLAKWTPVWVKQQMFPYQTNPQHQHYLWKHEPRRNEQITCGNIHMSVTMITVTNFTMLSIWLTWTLYRLWIGSLYPTQLFVEATAVSEWTITCGNTHMSVTMINVTDIIIIKPDTPINVYTRFCLNTAKSKFSLVSPVADWWNTINKQLNWIVY